MAMKRVPVLLGVILFFGCAGSGEERLGPLPTLVVHSPDQTFEVSVEVSATEESRRRGWMGRARLPEDRGMIFLYPDARPISFWMKNCLVPIDAAFIAESGQIVNIQEMSPPDPTSEVDPPSYPSAAPVRIVLEMPGGWFRDHGVGRGDRVELSAEIRSIEPR